MKSKKATWYSIAIIIVVYLITSSLPFSLWVKDSNVLFWLSFGLKFVFFIFAFFYIKKEKLDTKHISKPKKTDLLFLPFLLISISNLVVCWCFNSPMNVSIDGIDFLKTAIITILVTLAEELVFRTLLFNEMLKEFKPLTAILFSSLIFSLLHLLNINSVDTIVPVLIQCAYTFFLGILLSLIYYFSFNLIYIFVIHFAFNYLNNDVVSIIYTIPNNWQYYVINVCFAFIAIIYGVFIYYILTKRNKNVPEAI